MQSQSSEKGVFFILKQLSLQKDCYLDEMRSCVRRFSAVLQHITVRSDNHIETSGVDMSTHLLKEASWEIDGR